MEEHGDGLKQMLQDFAGIRVKQQASAGKLKSLKQVLKMKEEEVAFAHSNLAELQQEGVEKVNLIGNLGDLVGEIPEYKKRISELSESVDQSQRATQEKLEEMLKVQQKQDRENTMLEERIQVERVKERVRDETNIEELEKFLKGAQEIEVGNTQRRLEKEKEKVEEQTRMLEEENRLMRENHSRKIQMMNNQLLEANKASDQTKMISMENVRKDMEMMKQEYESQMGDLAGQIYAFKERKAGQAAAAKKKKVSFAFPDDVSSSATENQDNEKEAFGFIDEQRSRSFCITSSRLSNTGEEELGNEDGLESWRLGADTTAVAPHRSFNCASSFAGSTLSGRESSALGEDHSEAGAGVHHPSSYKFVATPAVKSREPSARVEAGRATTPQHSPFKFVARPAESSVLGLSTFAPRQLMAGNTELAAERVVVRGNLEDDRTGVVLQENEVDEVRLQEDSEGENRLQENQGCGYNQTASEICFKRRNVDRVSVPLQEVQISAGNSRSRADEGMDEGGDVMFSKKESTRNTEREQGGARKPVKRKLYSDTGDGPKILE